MTIGSPHNLCLVIASPDNLPRFQQGKDLAISLPDNVLLATAAIGSPDNQCPAILLGPASQFLLANYTFASCDRIG